MALFALSDLHLSGGLGKTMDRFGEHWQGHQEKIEINWNKTVGALDTVIIGGDISWAMRLEQAMSDLCFIESLPGKKIIHSGNHDFWWDSTSKLNEMFANISFLKNNYFTYKDYAVCGSRGWLCPNDSQFSAQDEKLYKREMLRCEASLQLARSGGYEKFIFTTHFPPTNDKKQPSGFTALIEKYRPQMAIYGHLHGRNSFGASLSGMVNGVEYRLVSADYLDFTPVRLLD